MSTDKQQIERIEFDHLTRAKRKYLVEQKIAPLITNSNKQHRLLLEKWNAANQKKHTNKIVIRDRLRHIKCKHLAIFAETVNTIKQTNIPQSYPIDQTIANEENINRLQSNQHIFSVSPLIQREQTTFLIDGYIRKIQLLLCVFIPTDINAIIFNFFFITPDVQNFVYRPKAITIDKLNDFPDWIHRGYTDVKGVYSKLNELESTIMSDLCLGNDSIITSQKNTANTAIIMSSFYRLFTKKADANVILICVDNVKVEILKNLCGQLGKYVPDLNIYTQRSEFLKDRRLIFPKTRNVFICLSEDAHIICSNALARAMEDLVTVTVFDCDSLLIQPLWEKLKDAFRWIPTNVNANFVSQSMCSDMERHLKQLIFFNNIKTKKYDFTN
eukprot:459995_1